MSEAKKFLATLIRGNVFYLGNQRFENGKGKVVDESTKEYLEENAVDLFHDSGESFEKPKFKFTEPTEADLKGDADAKPKANRTRNRG